MLNTPATLTDMARVKWKLGDFLKQRDITAYQLGKELGGQTRMPNLYRITNATDSGPSRIDLNLLAEILTTLEKLTGEKLSICDVLEYERD